MLHTLVLVQYIFNEYKTEFLQIELPLHISHYPFRRCPEHPDVRFRSLIVLSTGKTLVHLHLLRLFSLWCCSVFKVNPNLGGAELGFH